MGESISNTKARRIAEHIRHTKVWFDLGTQSWGSSGYYGDEALEVVRARVSI